MNGYDDILILVDSIKNLPHFPMTRCVYFTVECDTPGKQWSLGIDGQPALPFIMLGLSGILISFGPAGKHATSPDDFEYTIDLIEKNPDLSVGMADIWLPTDILANAAGTAPQRGDAFRIRTDAFKTAFLFRHEKIDLVSFMESPDMESPKTGEGPVLSSPEETRAIAAWQEMLIRRAIEESSHSDPQLKLPRIERPDNEPQGGGLRFA